MDAFDLELWLSTFKTVLGLRGDATIAAEEANVAVAAYWKFLEVKRK